jgi:hypothetical protein
MPLRTWKLGLWVGLLAFAGPGACGSSQDGGSPPPGAGAGGSGTAGSGGSGTAGSGEAGSGGSGTAGSGAAGSDVAGSGGSGTAGGGAAGSGGTPGGQVSIEGNRVTLRIVAADIHPDDEDHVCVTLATPNDEPVWVAAIHATLTPGSHHLIVDRLAPGADTGDQVTHCAPTPGGDGTRLIIAQQSETQVALPEGVAFRLAPRQPIFLQLHYFNYLEDETDIIGAVQLELADTQGTAPAEAKSLFTGPFSLFLPPGQETDVEYFLNPNNDGSHARHVFAVTSHTHQLGTHSSIERVASLTAPATAPLHESFDWAEPPLTWFNPPLVFTGEDGFRLRCRYFNDTLRAVTFGTGFHDEMCFMWVYYYDAP